MTKRFTTKNIICSNYCVWDTDDKPYGNDEVVDLLNEQHETIEELEKDNKEYIRGLDLAKATSQAWASDVRELREQNYRLEKENEQLKQKLHSKEDIIQQMKIKLNEDYYKKWKKTNLNYIRVCEELAEENRAYEKLAKENEQLKGELKDWKFNCLSIINEHSILWNEIAIMREQGAKPSSAFEEYCRKFKGDDVND